MNSSFSVEDDASSCSEEDFGEGLEGKSDGSNVVLLLSEDEGDFEEGRVGQHQYVPVVVGNVPLYLAEDGKPVYMRQLPTDPPAGAAASKQSSHDSDDDSSFGGFSDNSDSTFEGFGPDMFEGFTDDDTCDSDDSQFDGFSEESAEAVEGKQKIEYIRNWQKTSRRYDDLDLWLEDSADSLPDLGRSGTSRSGSSKTSTARRRPDLSPQHSNDDSQLTETGLSRPKRRRNVTPQEKPKPVYKSSKPDLGQDSPKTTSPRGVVYERKGKQQCLVLAPQLKSKDVHPLNEKDVSFRVKSGKEKTQRVYLAPDAHIKEEIEIKEEVDESNEDFIGPYCNSVGCTISWLESMKTKNVSVVNGMVYELAEFAKRINWEQSDVVKWILRLLGVLDVEPTEVDVNKIRSVLKRRKALMVTLAGNKRGQQKLEEFNAAEFTLPSYIKKEIDEADDTLENVVKSGHVKKRKDQDDKDEGCSVPSKRTRSRSVDVSSSCHDKVSKTMMEAQDKSVITPVKPMTERRRSHLDTETVDFSNAIKKSKRADNSKVSFHYHGSYVYPHFKETDVCLGKYCREAGLTIDDLNSSGKKDILIKNGLVAELYRFYRERSCTVTSLALRLLQLKDANSLNLVSLVVKITKLVQKTRRTGPFMEEEFHFPRPKSDDSSKSVVEISSLELKGKERLPDHSHGEQRSQQCLLGEDRLEKVSKENLDESFSKKSDVDKIASKVDESKDAGNSSLLRKNIIDKNVDNIICDKGVVEAQPVNDNEKKVLGEVVNDEDVRKMDSPDLGKMKPISGKPLLRRNKIPMGGNQENSPIIDKETLESNRELEPVPDKTSSLGISQSGKYELPNEKSAAMPISSNQSVKHCSLEQLDVLSVQNSVESSVKSVTGNCEDTPFEKEDRIIKAEPKFSLEQDGIAIETKMETLREENKEAVREFVITGIVKPEQLWDDDSQSLVSSGHSENDGSSHMDIEENIDANISDFGVNECKAVKNSSSSGPEWGQNVRDTSNTAQTNKGPTVERNLISGDFQLLGLSNSSSSKDYSTQLKHLGNKPCEVRRSDRERTLSVKVKEYHSVSEFYDEPFPSIFPKKLKMIKPSEEMIEHSEESQENYKTRVGRIVRKSRKRVTNGMALEFIGRRDPRVSFSIIDGRITPDFKDTSYYLGKYCEAAGLTVHDLNTQEPKDLFLTKGAVMELVKFYKLMGCTMTSLADRLLRLKKVYLDSILNLVARFQPLMRQEGNAAKMRQEFNFPPGQHNILKRTPNRKNPKTKNKNDSMKKDKKGNEPTYTCEVFIKPDKKKKKKKKKNKESELDVSKVHSQVFVDKEVEKARGKEGSVTRADIVLLYANWLNNKHKTGNNVFVTDLLQDVMKLMEERKVQTIRIPAGTLMSSSVKLYEEYRQMWITNKADAMMYLEDDWLEDIQYLVSITQTSRRNTMEMSEGGGNFTNDNRLAAPRSFEDDVREFSDSSSEKSLKIDESYFSSDEGLGDLKKEGKLKIKIEQKQKDKNVPSIKMPSYKSKPKEKYLQCNEDTAITSSSELQNKSSNLSKSCEVEEIIDYKCTLDENSKRHVLYLVRWKGCEPQQDTWVSENQLYGPKNLQGSLMGSNLSIKPSDKLIWQPPTRQQTMDATGNFRIANEAFVPQAGNSFHDEANDKENSPHNVCNNEYDTDKGYMTNGELLHIYDGWRRGNMKISDKNSVDIMTLTYKVQKAMEEYGIKTDYSDYLLQACFTLSLICKMLNTEDALKEFLDRDCLPALESSRSNQEQNNLNNCGSTKIAPLSASISKLKAQFREVRGKRSGNQTRVRLIEDEVERLERSLDRAQGKSELLRGALHQEINKLSKKISRLDEEEDGHLAKEFNSENPEKYKKACQDIRNCGVPEKNLESVMNSILQVIGKFSVDVKTIGDK
ncbi:uncharacterized protein [Palaemon carinicauda]|uniref:uncharacterized protein n=1 Tax=Palaemon carinicauda TaxID=392227 RepID=UPI0035B6A4D5